MELSFLTITCLKSLSNSFSGREIKMTAVIGTLQFARLDATAYFTCYNSLEDGQEENIIT